MSAYRNHATADGWVAVIGIVIGIVCAFAWLAVH